MGLMEEAETKQVAIDQANDLEEELARVQERLSETEAEAMSQQAAYESRVEDLQKELQMISKEKKEIEVENSTLKKTNKNKEDEIKRRQSLYETEISNLKKERDKLMSSNSSLSSKESGLPPPPPGPPMLPGPPGPPKPPGSGPIQSQTIKRVIASSVRLPTVQLNSLKPNQTKDTFWYTTNDEKLMKEIDWTKFEEDFKLNPTTTNTKSDRPGSSTIIPTPKLKSLMDHTRLRNVAICKRMLAMSIDEIVIAVKDLDNNAFPLDAIEKLQRIEPNDEERKAFKKYSDENKDPLELTEEDRFMMKLSDVQRLKPKLEIMSFMSTFFDILHQVKPRVETIYLASRSTRDATKFKKILELILTMGNYMNGTKKPPAYGFKMSTLDNLSLTKSTDKKSNLVNYLVEIVNTQFPDRKGFESELRFIENAAQLSLENISADVSELKKGMTLTLNELENRQKNPKDKNSPRTIALKDFCDNANGQLKKLLEEADKSKAAFNECLEHYGEDPKTMDASTFFAILKRFCESWKNAEQENIKQEKLRRERELREQENNNQKENVFDPNVLNSKKNNMHLIASELKNKTNNNSRKPINLDEVKDGTFEQMILQSKEPYCPRRSIRRTAERLMSRNFDEDL